jgi:hypothetical protein
MEYSKDFVLNSGGNRVATDGVDNYGRIKGLRFGFSKVYGYCFLISYLINTRSSNP